MQIVEMETCVKMGSLNAQSVIGLLHIYGVIWVPGKVGKDKMVNF